MKKVLIFILSSILVGLTLNVQAASITFDPSSIEFKVTPGEADSKTLTVHGFSSGFYSLNFSIGSKLGNGNVPLGWLSKPNFRLGSRTGGASSSSSELVVSVPSDAMAGTYTGVLEPEDLQSTEPLSSPGIIIAIEVTEPLKTCSGPEFLGVEIIPHNIWAPTDRDVEIEISGGIVAAGCDVTASYTLESSTGQTEGDITLDPDGSFREIIKANLSRSGRDKDGKTYNGILIASDEDGNTETLEFEVTVLHDNHDNGMKIEKKNSSF